MTKKELEVALSIATQNRRELAEAVLAQHNADESLSEREENDAYDRMISLAKELAK